MRRGKNPSVTPCGRATSPFVLRKNGEDLVLAGRGFDRLSLSGI